MRAILATAFYVVSLSAACFGLKAAGLAEDPPLQAAQFTDDGKLVIPDNLDEWVFLGSSLGMGYSQQSFDPNSPGMFQIVQMEPEAYRAFMRDGVFPEGAMFLLSFYGSANQVSINRSGFVMGEPMSYEIHLKDKARFPETGFNFYTFGPGDTAASEVPLPNDCVTCHARDGAFDGAFTQFYPHARERLARTAPK